MRGISIATNFRESLCILVSLLSAGSTGALTLKTETLRRAYPPASSLSTPVRPPRETHLVRSTGTSRGSATIIAGDREGSTTKTPRHEEEMRVRRRLFVSWCLSGRNLDAVLSNVVTDTAKSCRAFGFFGSFSCLGALRVSIQRLWGRVFRMNRRKSVLVLPTPEAKSRVCEMHFPTAPQNS